MAERRRVVFTGEPHNATLARYRELCELENDVHLFDWLALFRQYPILSAIESRTMFGPRLAQVNRRFLEFCQDLRPDVVWVDKGWWISQSTVRQLRAQGAFVAQHNTDLLRPMRWRTTWIYRVMRKALPEYDLYFTSNLVDYRELTARGTPKTELTYLGYDRDLFDDTPLPADEAAAYHQPIAFYGHHEPRTARGIRALADAGLPVFASGGDWKRAKGLEHLGDRIKDRHVPNEDYARYVKAVDIGLCFVSEHNKNETAARSFEIPACGTFLLAMRTPQHSECYEEGVEAEFFGDHEELVRKARFYLDNPEKRREIARRGHERCIRSDYSWQRYFRDDWAKILAAMEARQHQRAAR